MAISQEMLYEMYAPFALLEASGSRGHYEHKMALLAVVLAVQPMNVNAQYTCSRSARFISFIPGDYLFPSNSQLGRRKYY